MLIKRQECYFIQLPFLKPGPQNNHLVVTVLKDPTFKYEDICSC